jgi:predicted phage baseplate assembly protein
MTTYVCADRRRLLAVKLAGLLNGIEFLEVRDTDESDPARKALRQRTLLVRLLDPVPAGMGPGSVVIDNGERIRSVEVLWAVPATALPGSMDPTERASILDGLDEPDHVLVVRTDQRGDFSRYRFALVAGPGSADPPVGFDPVLAELAFSFKVECPSAFDCRRACTCPTGVVHPPPIDYLAKDYQGFRRLMLDRMALLAPEWQQRSAADVGVMLVELLASVADELSYRQDAVATEAYLHTARSRVSLRRHARLVDYRMHDGCNARAWVHVRVGAPTVVLPAGTQICSTVAGLAPRIVPDSADHAAVLAADPVVFETVDEAVLHAGLEELRFWTWGAQDCCLPQGATAATVRGHWPQLRAGEVVVLAETVSPRTGSAADADPALRAAVRLVEVRTATDPSGELFPDGTTEITELRWHPDDALPFPLCLTSEGAETARVWGNLVLADHGRTLPADPPEVLDWEDLGQVPQPRLRRVTAGACDCGSDADPGLGGGSPGSTAVTDGSDVIPPRFRPTLRARPLTQAVAAPVEVLAEVPLDAGLAAELASGASGDALQALFAGRGITVDDGSVVRGIDPLWSVQVAGHAWQLRERSGRLQVLAEHPAARAVAAADPRAAAPALRVRGVLGTVATGWSPRPDLLGSAATASELVVETEHDGTARLRFGDGEHGLRPAPGTRFSASYRVGNGAAGNVGRDSLVHVITTTGAITGVTNPLPASGGTEPESGDEVRRDAPAAFQVQERAVTTADYEEVALRQGAVERAAATVRWTGSWHTVFVTADRFGNAPVDAAFEADLRGWLERFRMAGVDLEVDGPIHVPIELALHVCVLPGFHRADVAADVHAVLSNRTLPDGRQGLFHPDRLTFAQDVYLSSVLAQVHSVAGVQSVQVVRFQRRRDPATSGIEAGVLPMGRLEVARLDDDPSFPERGALELTFGGGS